MTTEGRGGSDVLSVRPAVWVGPGGPCSRCVRKGISAQVSLYIWGTAEWCAPFILICDFWVTPEGNVFLLEVRQSPALYFWIAKLEGLWASSLRKEV